MYIKALITLVLLSSIYAHGQFVLNHKRVIASEMNKKMLDSILYNYADKLNRSSNEFYNKHRVYTLSLSEDDYLTLKAGYLYNYTDLPLRYKGFYLGDHLFIVSGKSVELMEQYDYIQFEYIEEGIKELIASKILDNRNSFRSIHYDPIEMRIIDKGYVFEIIYNIDR